MQPSPPSRHPRHSGEDKRATIRAAIRARQNGDQHSPTLDELVADLAMNKSTVRHHVRWLVENGDIQVREATREVTRQELVLIEPAVQS